MEAESLLECGTPRAHVRLNSLFEQLGLDRIGQNQGDTTFMINSDETQIMKTEQRWVRVHQDLNITDIEDILDEGFRRIEGDTVVGKQEVVASYRSGQRLWELAEGSGYSVQVFESFAVVVGAWRGLGVNHGERFDYHARFLAVYVKRSAGWKLFRDETFEL